MPSTVNLFGNKLFYRVNHPEFDPACAYRALAYIDYGESAWSQLLFITLDGKTYSVKVHRCLCINAMDDKDEGRDVDYELCDVSEIALHFKLSRIFTVEKLPWPEPNCRNPDLHDD